MTNWNFAPSYGKGTIKYAAVVSTIRKTSAIIPIFSEDIKYPFLTSSSPFCAQKRRVACVIPIPLKSIT